MIAPSKARASVAYYRHDQHPTKLSYDNDRLIA
jgi:hypothetical protein